MNSRNAIILLFIATLMLFVVFNSFLISKTIFDKSRQAGQPPKSGGDYSPQINPKDFTSNIDNKYFAFTPGTIFIYRGETEEGTERIEVFATQETKRVMGVTATVVRDRVWLNNELIEDTRDWYAQDNEGNVWYFGEDSKEIANGKVVSTKGSWEAGVDGAKPGMIMEANPKAGGSYRQEYYKGQAEDMAEVVALGVNIKTKYGSFSNCLQTREWTPLEAGADEYKYYCPEIGNLVYEVGVSDGNSVQLIDIDKGQNLNQLNNF